MIYQLPVDGERKLVLPVPPPHFGQYGDVWISYSSDLGNLAMNQPMPPNKNGVVGLRTFVFTTAGVKPGDPGYWHGLGGNNGNGLWTCTPGGRYPIKLVPGDLEIVVERTNNADMSPCAVLIEVYPGP